MDCHLCGNYTSGPFIYTKGRLSHLYPLFLPQVKLSYLCLSTTWVHLWRKRKQKILLFHKIGQFSFGVKSGNVTRKSLGGGEKVLGISCSFADNEFRKDDFLSPSLKKKKNVYLPFCFPIQTGMITFGRSTFKNGVWKRKPPTLKNYFPS